MGQGATTVASFLFVGMMIFRIVGNRDFSGWSMLIYLPYTLISFLFSLAIWRNWRGIVDEQVVREHDRARQAGYRFLLAPEKWRNTLQRINKWMTFLWGMMVLFVLASIVLYLTGYFNYHCARRLKPWATGYPLGVRSRAEPA
jgi:hypothetical protein